MGSGPEHAELLRLRDSLGLAACIDMPGRVTNEFLFTGLQTMDLGVACDPINDYNDHCTMNKTLEYMAFSKAQVMFGTREGRFSAGEGRPLRHGKQRRKARRCHFRPSWMIPPGASRWAASATNASAPN
jgi:hypothetical protein